MCEWIKCSEKMMPKGKTVVVWYNGDYEFGMTFDGVTVALYEDGWRGTKIDAIAKDIRWIPLSPPHN